MTDTVVHYSRGKKKFDNCPEQRTCNGFDEFEKAVITDLSPLKGMAFICAPLKWGVHYQKPEKYPGEATWRLKDYALPRQFLAFDFDGFSSPDVLLVLMQYMGSYRGFGYTTASHTDEAPRARAILHSSRPVSREEGIIICKSVQEQISSDLGVGAVIFDESVYRGEQPVYTPVTTSEFYHFDGSAVDVDAHLNPTQTPIRTTRDSGLQSALCTGSYATPDRVKEGERNSAVLAHVGHLRGSNVPEELIPGMALDFNHSRCISPLDEDEVLGIVSRYEEQVQISPADLNSDEWPDLQQLPSPLPVAPKLNLKSMPNTLEPFVLDVAKRMQVPAELVLTPLLISIGSVLGKKLAVQPKQNDTSWFEFPNLWGVAILEPGMLKSPVLYEATKFINELNERARLSHGSAMMMWDTNEPIRKIEKEDANQRAKKLILAGNKLAAEAILNPLSAIIPPIRERYVITDTTPEARLRALSENPNGVMLIRDELSGHIAQLSRDGYEQARSQELQLFDGKFDYEDDRMKRAGIFAEKPRMAIFGNLQPSKIEKYLGERDNSAKGVDDGYMERLLQLSVWPQMSQDYKVVDLTPDVKAEQLVRLVFKTAAGLPLNRDALNGGIVPRTLKFTPDAQQSFFRAMEAIENNARKQGGSGRIKSHLGKYRGTLAKLAAIIAFAENVQVTEISIGALHKAVQLLAFYKEHAVRIYALAEKSDLRSADELINRIKKGQVKDGFAIHEVVQRKFNRLSSTGEVAGAASVLEAHGYLKTIQGPSTGGRQPTKLYINPDLGCGP